jgi:hypothetical protein
MAAPAIAAAVAIEIRRDMTPAPRKKFIGLPGGKICIPQKGLFHRGRDFREIRAWPVCDTAQIFKEVTVPFHRS